MGMFRDNSDQEFDIVKEMAESLGSTGLRVEEMLERVKEAQQRTNTLLACYHQTESCSRRPDLALVNESIRDFNSWVEKAEDALRWLLIQREACGFRTHKNVNIYYPIPSKMKLIKP
jgi:hypothetical protein